MNAGMTVLFEATLACCLMDFRSLEILTRARKLSVPPGLIKKSICKRKPAFEFPTDPIRSTPHLR